MNNKRNLKWLVGGIKGLFQVALGINYVKFEVLVSRIHQCGTCDHIKDEKCDLCGCTLTYKLLLKDQHCPIDIW